MREIERLTRILSKRRAEREAYRLEEQMKGARDKEIETASQYTKNCEFWCEECQLDFTAWGFKCVESDWTIPNWRIAYYKGKCPKGHKAIRRITDKPLDPYFIKSLILKKQRVDYKRDILQENDFGFNMLYK
jgi:hypothetical protein